MKYGAEEFWNHKCFTGNNILQNEQEGYNQNWLLLTHLKIIWTYLMWHETRALNKSTFLRIFFTVACGMNLMSLSGLVCDCLPIPARGFPGGDSDVDDNVMLMILWWWPIYDVGVRTINNGPLYWCFFNVFNRSPIS